MRLSTTGRGRARGPPQFSAEEQFHQRVTGTPVAVPPIRVEFLTFCNLMQDACKKGIDPLTFYAIHGLQILIFARISSEVLPVSTVSGDVERIFSISGKVYSPDRSYPIACPPLHLTGRCLLGSGRSNPNSVPRSKHHWVREFLVIG